MNDYEILFFKEIDGEEYAVMLNDIGNIALEKADSEIFSIGEVFFDAEPTPISEFPTEVQDAIYEYLAVGM